MKRFGIRDNVTKKFKVINYSKTGVKSQDSFVDFSSVTAAENYLSSLDFGLGNYYEIYDTKNKEIISPRIYKNENNRGRL